MVSYVFTNTGKAKFVTILSGQPVTWYLSLGSNPADLTAAETDIALFSEIGPRIIGTATAATTNTTDDTLQITGALSITGPVSIAEAGISDTPIVPVVGVLQPASTVIGSTGGTTVVSDVPLNPGNGGFIQIRNEVMQVVSGTGTTNLTVSRGQAGTVAISTIAANDPIAQGNPPGVSTVPGGSLYVKGTLSSPLNLVDGDTIVYTWNIVLQ